MHNGFLSILYLISLLQTERHHHSNVLYMTSNVSAPTTYKQITTSPWKRVHLGYNRTVKWFNRPTIEENNMLKAII